MPLALPRPPPGRTAVQSPSDRKPRLTTQEVYVPIVPHPPGERGHIARADEAFGRIDQTGDVAVEGVPARGLEIERSPERLHDPGTVAEQHEHVSLGAHGPVPRQRLELVSAGETRPELVPAG